MIYGISGAPVAAGLAYAEPINRICVQYNFPPLLAYSVANRETIRGERAGLWPSASAVVSGDGGHGLFQLTSWFPADWVSPDTNTWAALHGWLIPSMHYFAGRGMSGNALIDIIADSFNEGTGRAVAFANRGVSPDIGTTGGDYGRDVLGCYTALLAGGSPT